MDDINVFTVNIGKNSSYDTFMFPTTRIVFVEHGEFDWVVGKETYSLKSGDFIILPNVIFRRISTMKSEFITLKILELNLYEFHLSLKDSAPFYQVHQITNGTNTIKQLLELIENEYCSESVSESICKHLVESLLLYVSKNYANDHKYNQRIENILICLEYIWFHLDEPLTVAELSSKQSISRYHFERIFKFVIGIGISEYVRRCRVYKTIQQLKIENKNILTVAFECGFTSSSGFYKAFNDIIGCSPTQYFKKLND